MAQETRMEFYLKKEKDWTPLSKGVWAKGGLEALQGIKRLNGPHGYVASSLTNLDPAEACAILI